MAKVRARVLKRSVKRVGRGGEVLLSPRDANILSRLGHVELLDPSSDRSTYAYATDRQGEPDSALATPEAPLETVAHADPPKRRKAKASDEGAEKPKRKRRSRKKKVAE